MKNLPLVLAVAAAFLGACKGTDWTARLHAEPLYRRAENIRSSPSCAALVPMEFGRTAPVPAREGGSRFKVLFYPLASSPGKAEVLTPLFEGGFASAEGSDSCVKLVVKAAEPLGPAVPPGLSFSEYDRQQARLFAALGPAADAYWRGGPVRPEEEKALADFAESFSAVAEPPLLPYYYRLNPDFWEWLRARTGRSIPKPIP